MGILYDEVCRNMKISTVKSYLIISIGTFMMAVGIYFFEFPNGFSTGGVSGIAIILSRVIDGLSPTKIATILNFLLILVGLVILGKKFAFKTVFTTGLLSLFLNLFENFLPHDIPFTNQKLLELFIDMILISLGAALIFNEEASSGGTDIIALCLSRVAGLIDDRRQFCQQILKGGIFGLTAGNVDGVHQIPAGFLVNSLDGILQNRRHCRIHFPAGIEYFDKSVEMLENVNVGVELKGIEL